MKKPSLYKLNMACAAVVLLGFFCVALIKPETEISHSERRKLQTFPKLTAESLLSGSGGNSFAEKFELYAKDQFPLREQLRKVHAAAGRTLFGRTELNDLYVADGYIAKLEDEIHEADLDWSAGRIEQLTKIVQQRSLQTVAETTTGTTSKTDGKILLAVIPDKAQYLAPGRGYPYVSAEEIETALQNRFSKSLPSIELSAILEKEDYYFTDTHWRQERIIDVADTLLEALGRDPGGYASVLPRLAAQRADVAFAGVYHGQAASLLPPEEFYYLIWDGCEKLQVTCYDTGKPVPMELYDLSAAQENTSGSTAQTMDPYELFLGGSRALITIENPQAPDGELVLFRDSFGSSLAPLLSGSYRKITLVDIRYLSPSMVERFVNLQNSDVVFLYSTSVLNNSIGQMLK